LHNICNSVDKIFERLLKPGKFRHTYAMPGKTFVNGGLGEIMKKR
jgi:hypothetical protein